LKVLNQTKRNRDKMTNWNKAKDLCHQLEDLIKRGAIGCTFKEDDDDNSMMDSNSKQAIIDMMQEVIKDYYVHQVYIIDRIKENYDIKFDYENYKPNEVKQVDCIISKKESKFDNI
jgi:hypothetical protein